MTQKSESVYFSQIFRDYLRRLYCHHANKALNLESTKRDNNAIVLLKKRKHTLCTLMEGNMFWNIVAMSLTCMPSDPKLLRMSSGWWVNCCSCILCFFRDETTSLIREYWGKKKKESKGSHKNWKIWKHPRFLAVWAPECVHFENITIKY